MKAPDSVKNADLNNTLREGEWKNVFRTVHRIAVLILAFAAVSNLEQCDQILLADGASLSKAIKPWQWNGSSPFYAEPTQWYKIVAVMISGRRMAIERISMTCLYSNWGWSVFLDCLGISGESEPFSVEPGKIWLQRVVPYQKGAVAHGISDGPDTRGTVCWAKKVKTPQDRLQLRCADPIEAAGFLISHRNDFLLINREYRVVDPEMMLTRLSRSSIVSQIISVGLCLMSEARWQTLTVGGCSHGDLDYDMMTLGVGTAAACRFKWIKEGDLAPKERVVISLVYRNDHARWLAIIGGYLSQPIRQIIIRGPSTCVPCFVSRASQVEGDLLLVI